MIGMAGRSVYLPLSIKHSIDLGSKEALRRGVMHLFNIDFALEWPRALPPNVKLVGPLMPEPAKPLPTDLQVHYPAPCQFLFSAYQALPVSHCTAIMESIISECMHCAKHWNSSSLVHPWKHCKSSLLKI